MSLLLSTEIFYCEITKFLINKGLTVSTMESCTSGLVATMLTNMPGSSAIMKGAFVTYCNEAKIMQGVNPDIIDKYGVYSKETAIEMAYNCKNTYNSDIGIGITGVLDRIDPENVTDKKSIFYAIIFKDKVITKELSINNNIDGRFNRKLFVALDIAIKLGDFINETYKNS